MRYYPIFLDLRGRRVVVVGGGKVAERKVRKLLRAGARVRVISPELTRGLARLAEQKGIHVTRRRYRKGDLEGRVGAQGLVPLLVYAATDDPAAQRAVLKDAKAAGGLANRADSAGESDFIVPASFTRGDLHVAISTSGTNPALARLLKHELRVRLAKKYDHTTGKSMAKGKGQMANDKSEKKAARSRNSEENRLVTTKGYA